MIKKLLLTLFAFAAVTNAQAARWNAETTD